MLRLNISKNQSINTILISLFSMKNEVFLTLIYIEYYHDVNLSIYFSCVSVTYFLVKAYLTMLR